VADIFANMNSYSLRPATKTDFAFLQKLHKLTLKPYVEQIWGWNDLQQEKLLCDRFDPAKLQVIQIESEDVGVLQVEEKIEQIEERPDQNILLARFSERIGQAFWLNNDYLIFTVGNELKTVEVDNRDQPNIADLAEFNSPQIYFNKENKKALVLTEGNLLISNQILP